MVYVQVRSQNILHASDIMIDDGPQRHISFLVLMINRNLNEYFIQYALETVENYRTKVTLVRSLSSENYDMRWRPIQSYARNI